MSCHQPGRTTAHLQDLGHHATRHHGRSLGEPPDELVQKLLGADLQVHRVAAVADEVVERVEREQRLVWVARVDVSQERMRCLPGAVGLFGLDQLGELNVDGMVGLGQRRVARLFWTSVGAWGRVRTDEGLDRGQHGPWPGRTRHAGRS